MDRNARIEPVAERKAFRGDASTRGLAQVLARNIRALRQRHAQEEARAGTEQRLARAITDFTGSMRFVYLHVALFGA